ncbi:MAG: UDP-glucose 4-epimerase GalE [Pseudonocardiales bacterium]|nr:MAG: UDP-glucose 4-epimerase GalE [Pseudonocardiales bacterium]
MRVLVTGGAGYVGSVVSAVLLASGHRVTVLDDLSTGHRDAVAGGIDFVHGSIHDADAALAGESFDAVLHFAAKSLVAESVSTPEAYWSNNAAGSLALFESMRRNDVRRIVFSSTAATYGEPAEVPILESAPTRPTNPYGASKLTVDHMLASYAAAYDFAAVSLRYFNVAGACLTPDAAIGERHAPETHLIPIALQVAGTQRPYLRIHGTSYPTPDGTCVRDYIHVLDLSDAHLQAMDRAREGEHLICNLGSGSGSSVREVVQSVRAITGQPVPTEEGPPRPGDPAILVASSALAERELGWRPSRGLDEIVSDSWAFAQRRAR